MKYFMYYTFLLTVIYTHGQTIHKAKLDTMLATKIAEQDPSLFVGVVQNGEVVYEKYSGVASLQHKVKVNENSRSNIASVAKQFTALCILKLSLEKKLNLEDDIRKYLPKMYPAIDEEIKIRHLLNHTSGIRDYCDLLSIQRKPWWKQVGMDNENVITLLEAQEELNFEPGTDYLYSNSNYTLLTKIVAIVSGQSFHNYAKTLFEELGMKQTTFLKNYMYIIPDQVLPYSDWGDGVWQQYPMLTNVYGDGFLFTTLKDQLIFEQALQNAHKTNNRLLLESQQPIPNSEIKSYGFGLELEDRLKHKAVHHSGGTGSYHAQTVRFPEQKLAVFVMSSNSKIWSGAIADEVASVFLPEQKNVEEKAYLANITSSNEVLRSKDILGKYRTPKGNLIRISEDNDVLFFQMDNNNPLKLGKESNGLYFFEANSNIKISFTKDYFELYQPNKDVRTYKKIETKEIKLQDLQAFVGEYTNEALEASFDLSLSKDQKLMLLQHGMEKAVAVEILTLNDLLVQDYRMKVNYDAFHRVKEILLTTNRLRNIRFTKKEELKFQPQIPTKNGSIQVTTIGATSSKSSQILLTKNYSNGNEIWSKQYGGKSYDKAASIISTPDNGYLLVGSTSSYGKGNYDAYVIKVDEKGKEQWSKTYGDFYNEYGYTAEVTSSGYLIKGTKQDCSSNSDVFNRQCSTNVWLVTINKKGKEISNEILEQIE